MKQWLAITGLSVGLGLAAWAQNTPLHAKVSVNWPRPGLPVADALREIGTKAKTEFAFEAALVQHLDPVMLTMDEVAAGRIAMRILRPRGLKLEDADGNRPRVVKADPFGELRPKREEVFAFARKPTLTRRGDDVTIAFETKGWCDVTVAIEHGERIVRHLASGVLGMNAPEPFVWNSKAQTIVWDGKDDAGVYVDDKDAVTVRVSLGLKPQFERTLYWAPERRVGNHMALAAAPDGVFVFDTGQGVDQVRMFDREGRYVRTIYPFPASKTKDIPDMIWHALPDGPRIPVKPNTYQSTFLKGGSGHEYDYSREEGRYRATGNTHDGKYGWSGRAMAATGRHVALSGAGVNRLATDGASGGLPLYGPDVASRRGREYQIGHRHGVTRTSMFVPQRIALSPDAQWLYLTRRIEAMVGRFHSSAHWDGHEVQRVHFARGGKPETFLGTEKAGSETGLFNMPSDVATDPQGRIYVADHGNHRVQVFSPDGKHVRSLDIKHPAQVSIHQRTGDIYVFCWPIPLHGQRINYSTGGGWGPNPLPSHGNLPAAHNRVHKFSSLDAGAKPLAAWNLPMRPTRGRRGYSRHFAEIDSWAEPTTIWVTPGSSCAPQNVLVLRETGDTLEPIRDFHEEARRAVRRTSPVLWQRQRLYVNPADGALFVGEASEGESKTFRAAMRIEPDTGRLREIELPMSTEDMAFDRDGHVYLRTADQIIRYDSETWREIPFDYGEERASAGAATGSAARGARVISGSVFPGNRGWHQGGMHINARGDMAVGALYETSLEDRRAGASVHAGAAYQPLMYAGRHYDPGGRFGGILVHVMDRHGKMLHYDAVPGLLSVLNGVGLDADRRLYLLAHRTRAYNGEAGWNPFSGTLMRMTPGQGRILSNFGAPVPLTDPPRRPPDMLRDRRRSGATWAENAHWFYGGGGWGGHNSAGISLCSCWNARFALDYFARSFTPEVARYNVGVVDANGNLILRVGQYGNVDDGMPLVGNEQGASRSPVGPPNPRLIGGGEVALMHPAFVATHSDRRLFVADSGNARIVSVKLGYHVNETFAIKDVPDEGK